ncbi:MAG: hypothetical protein FWH40_08905 [Coriobacteriia bacterium]|nr:hypothetical protein [Coriobacteriia bacterium]
MDKYLSFHGKARSPVDCDYLTRGQALFVLAAIVLFSFMTLTGPPL